MSRPAPRRPSRTTTPKPRKIAGRDVAPADPAPDADQAPPSLSLKKPPAAAAPSAPPKPSSRPKPVSDPDDRGPSRLGSPVLTRVLLVLIGALVVLLVLQGVWFYVHHQHNEDRAHELASAASGPEKSDAGAPIPVPSGRPVILDQLAVQDGVDAAAAAAQAMFARSWKSYDSGVDQAVKLMTSDFARQFRATTDDVKKEFVAQKTEVQVRVVAQSVVRANATELQALIFLNEYIFRGVGKDAKTTYTPYRALLTMVHTDHGWLVDGVDTK